MRFDGDIIITDPAYIAEPEDWERCRRGNDMDLLGFENFMVGKLCAVTGNVI
jgi:hypothetical protein